MMPGIDPGEDARKRRARIGLCIYWVVVTASTVLLSGTRFGAWRWMPGILGITGMTVFTVIATLRCREASSQWETICRAPRNQTGAA